MKPWEYEPPVWGLQQWDELHRVKQPPEPRWKRALRRIFRRHQE